MACPAKSYRAQNMKFAKAFGDDELVNIATVQVQRSLKLIVQDASQRDFDRIVRREVRRRGLKWEPPRLGT